MSDTRLGIGGKSRGVIPVPLEGQVISGSRRYERETFLKEHAARVPGALAASTQERPKVAAITLVSVFDRAGGRGCMRGSDLAVPLNPTRSQ